MLNRNTTLASGRRVRLRLPHGTDRLALRALHARLGHAVDDRALADLIAHDPRERAAVCVVAWTTDGLTVLGFAAGDVGATGPDVLLAEHDADHADLVRVLTVALAERTGPPAAAAA